MSKLNVLHAEIKAQRLANLALRDELAETRAERDEALAEIERLKAAGAGLANAAHALDGHTDPRMATAEREQLRNALDAWDVTEGGET